jgi:hypothetical protein
VTNPADSAKTPKVPAAVRPVVDEIMTIIDAFCSQHLDTEYAQLCGKVAAKLARKRPSPLLRGGRHIWAAGIVYAVGRVNFLADPSQRPHLRTDELASLLGVKQPTMANKGRLILDTLHIGLMDPEYWRRDLLEHHPLAWLLEVDGLIMDARSLPDELQVEAWHRGLIPSPPGHAAQGAAKTSASALDHVIETIVVDCYNEDEVYTSFLTVIEDEVAMPASASLLGTPVTVVGLDYPDPARGLVAACQAPHGTGEVAFADIAFPADTLAAWLHAAYRHYLGLKPFPATARPDWTWPHD